MAQSKISHFLVSLCVSFVCVWGGGGGGGGGGLPFLFV